MVINSKPSLMIQFWALTSLYGITGGHPGAEGGTTARPRHPVVEGPRHAYRVTTGVTWPYVSFILFSHASGTNSELGTFLLMKRLIFQGITFTVTGSRSSSCGPWYNDPQAVQRTVNDCRPCSTKLSHSGSMLKTPPVQPAGWDKLTQQEALSTYKS